MRIINYILINEDESKNVAYAIRNCYLLDIRYHCIIDPKVSRRQLIKRLVRLRLFHPDAKILGISELGIGCVHPSEAMNQLRKELSEWP